MSENPNVEELKKWIVDSNLPIKRFFNTQGVVYREMNLKDKIDTMNEDEALEILASTGKLVKRPLLISDEGVFVGFHEELYESLIP